MFVQGRLTTALPPGQNSLVHCSITYCKYVIVREYTPKKYGLIVRLKPLNMVRRPLLSKPKGYKGVDAEERPVNTNRRREKRGKAHESSTVNFGVKNEWGELSFYRESS